MIEGVVVAAEILSLNLDISFSEAPHLSESKTALVKARRRDTMAVMPLSRKRHFSHIFSKQFICVPTRFMHQDATFKLLGNGGTLFFF